MKATTEDWAVVERFADLELPRCILELRARVEALEAQAAQPAQPAQAEQGQEQGKELWERMLDAAGAATAGDGPLWPALMDAVADWLAAGHPTFATAANALRAEARCTREGRRG